MYTPPFRVVETHIESTPTYLVFDSQDRLTATAFDSSIAHLIAYLLDPDQMGKYLSASLDCYRLVGCPSRSADESPQCLGGCEGDSAVERAG